MRKIYLPISQQIGLLIFWGTFAAFLILYLTGHQS